jgi:hypothetical protein
VWPFWFTFLREEVLVMAINKVPQLAVMCLEIQAGVTKAGNPLLKKIRFPNVKFSTTDADFFEIANAIGGLQSFPVTAIERIDTETLVNG